MRVNNVYIRFYKSFNFDYLRKTHDGAQPSLWEDASGGWFPYVQVALEDDITTVVGANESGKSQLLTAIKCALTGDGIERSDFCRYSQFFAVDQAMRLPDFGLEFTSLSENDRDLLGKACGVAMPADLRGFALFRRGEDAVTAYLKPFSGEWTHQALESPAQLEPVMPKVFEISATIPLPDSVSISVLASGLTASEWPRRRRQAILGKLFQSSALFESPTTIQTQAPAIFEVMSDPADEQVQVQLQMLQLADDLLVKVAGISRTAFEELSKAINEGAEGYANGIVEKINEALATSLNFPKWWSQDSEFTMLVTLRDRDLVFTVRDRTGTEYSFAERSGGLKYFLSYFVQYLAHEPRADGAPEILLMDEPDAFLSSQGQQDLLRIFDGFAHPSDDRSACQVVYVTHSPFLIDKNHGERIRVLEKGELDEGTRVVRDAGRNHYEPLRSAFGGFVGETTFISNVNLMLEGMSDQILLAGMSAYLRSKGQPRTENLDLNEITLVPTGSASHMPYMAYLARGRDAERPAVIALLDSDKGGSEARAKLEKGPGGKQLLPRRFVLQVGDLDVSGLATASAPIQIEDLVPLEICIAATKAYASEFLDAESAAKVATLKPKDVTWDAAKGMVSSMEVAVQGLVGKDFHLDKIGFARNVVRMTSGQDSSVSEKALTSLRQNFTVLFARLATMQRAATREFREDRTSSRINRARRSFLRDHATAATREDARLLLEEIEIALDTSIAADQFKLQVRKLREDFELDTEIFKGIKDFEGFKTRMEALAYYERRTSQDTT